MYAAFISLEDAQKALSFFNGKGECFKMSKTKFKRYAVIRETFNDIGTCTSHAIVMETDNYIDAKGTAEKERHKAAPIAGDLPQVYVSDRMKGVYTK